MSNESLFEPMIAQIEIDRMQARQERKFLNPPDEQDEDEPSPQYIRLQIARQQRKTA